MKKIYLPIILFCLLAIIFVPLTILADDCTPWQIGCPIVPSSCQDSPCGLGEFFEMLGNIYSFIVWEIATPLAVVAISIGAILMMISAGNPNMFGMGKKILYAAIIGVVLVFGSWVIIETILNTIGYTGSF